MQKTYVPHTLAAEGMTNPNTLTSFHYNTFLFILFFPKGISKRFRDAFIFCHHPTQLGHTQRAPATGWMPLQGR